MSDTATMVLDHHPHTYPTAEPVATYLTAIEASEMFADHRYQRDLDMARVRRIARQWDPRRINIIDVADRGPANPQGRWAVINGQHRWAAAGLLNPYMALVARVHTGLSLAEEAHLCRELDRRHTPAPENTGHHPTGAAAAAGQTVVEQLLDDATHLTVTAWSRRGDHIERPFVLAVALILHHYRTGLDRDRFAEVLAGLRPRQIAARMDTTAHANTSSRATALAAAGVMVAAYNRSRGLKLDPAALAAGS
ncbi:DUF6551 family protein [Nocardia sp. NPDC049220]|uniref:DUF6551 family protein n=1 Tax=Nocardia sp. NPDC049220 TaxID=3155273 RepID=UPI00340B69F4